MNRTWTPEGYVSLPQHALDEHHRSCVPPVKGQNVHQRVADIGVGVGLEVKRKFRRVRDLYCEHIITAKLYHNTGWVTTLSRSMDVYLEVSKYVEEFPHAVWVRQAPCLH